MNAERWVKFAYNHARHNYGTIAVLVVTRGQNTPDHIEDIEDITPKRARALAADLTRRADEIEQVRQ